MEKETKFIEVKLPGLFSPPEILTAFRNAASFEENEKRRWEMHTVDGTQFENLRDHEGMNFIFARPLYFKRTMPMFGKKGKWTPSEESGKISGSTTAICLAMNSWNWTFDTRCKYPLDTVYLAVHHSFETKDGREEALDPNDRGFAEFRAAYDRIRADFLTNLIELTYREPVTQGRRRDERAELEKKIA